MADRYLVASGNVTWNSSNTALWSATSGGATGASVPTSADDVFIDANSGTGTIKFATVVCKSLNFTGFTGTFAHDSAGSNLTIHGGLTMVAGMTSGVTSGTFTFASTTDNGGAGWPITTNGKKLPNVTFNGVGGRWQLQDAITYTSFMLRNGTFDSNNKNMTGGTFQCDSGTKTLILGSSTITISAAGNTIVFYNGDPTITANTATFVILTGSGFGLQAATDFNGASLDIQTNNGGGFTISASTWANITCTTLGAKPLALSGNVIVTGTLTLAGTGSTVNRQYIYSTVLGTTRVIVAAATSLTDVDFMDIAIVGPTGSTITSDSFNRADGPLDTTDAAAGGSALAWTANNGTWSVDSNKAASTSTGLVYRSATVDAGVTDMAVEAVITPGSQIWGLNARFTDQNNRIFIQHNGTQFAIGQIKDGTQTTIFTTNISFSAGDKVCVAVVGNGVAAYKNDVCIGSALTYTLTGTRAGLTTYGTDLVRRFDDFKVLNAPNVTGTRLGDCLGNSGITFTTASGTARDGGGAGVKRYAVAPGNFSDTAMWSETSGGSPGASVPLPQDDVYLDANSAAGTYNINIPRSCRNLDCTGFTKTLNNGNESWSIYGNLKIVPGMTWNFHSIGPNLCGRGAQTIDTSGVVPGGGITNTYVAAPGGSYTLLSNLSLAQSTQSALTVGAGTFDANGYNVTANRVDAPGTGVKTINFGSGTWTLGFNTWFIASLASANTTIIADASTIVINAARAVNRDFIAQNSIFGTLTYTVADSPGALTISGSNTFNTLNIGSGRSLRLTSGTTQKIGTLNLNGVPRGGVRFQGVSGTFLSTPDSAAVSVTGDIDIRVRAALTDWTPGASQAFLGKYRDAGNQGSYIFAVDSLGRLVYYVTETGGGAPGLPSVAGPWVDGATYWVRVSHTTGQLRFFYAPDSSSMPTSWTQLGIDNTIFGLPKYDSTAALEIGAYNNGASMPMTGIIYRVQIRNNVLDNGTGIVFDTDLSVPFGPNFYDTANGAVITPSNTLANVSDGRVVIESVTANSPATLQVDTVTGMNYVDLKDVVMNGADTYIGATSVIRTNVKGVRRGPKTGLGV